MASLPTTLRGRGTAGPSPSTAFVGDPGLALAACMAAQICLLPGTNSASDLYLHKIGYFFKKTLKMLSV
jgi:hypothetical protein